MVTDDEKDDKIWKIRPWIDQFHTQCLKVTPEEHNAIDEMMIPFKGSFSGIKQYMKGKPHKWGFKIWARAGQSGLLYDFDVYQGRGGNRSDPSGLGVGADVVLKLTSSLPDNKNYKVYADNFFTGLPLIEELQKRGLHYLGTARSNRIYNCTLQSDRDFQKSGRGTYDFRVEQNHNFVAVKWHDTRAVTLVYTFAGPEPLSEVRRWDKKQKKHVLVDVPFTVREYNSFMGGVDLLGCFLAKYRYPLRSRRWYMPLFWNTLFMGLVNAWILYRRDCQSLGLGQKSILKRRNLQAQVASALIEVNTAPKRGRPSHEEGEQAASPRPPRKIRHGPCVDVQKDLYAHLPVKVDKRGRCKVCKVNITDTLCEKCDVRLCFNEKRNCYRQFHV